MRQINIGGINKNNINKISYGPAPKYEERNGSAVSGFPAAKKLFISHACKDKDMVDAFVSMLTGAGVPDSILFYSSSPGSGIPVGCNIYEYLRRQLINNVYVIFMLSENYYDSTACVSEMGAVWALNAPHCVVLLPGLGYRDIREPVPASEAAISFQDNTPVLRDKLGQLRRQIERHFDLEIVDSKWEKSRERFLGTLRRRTKKG